MSTEKSPRLEVAIRDAFAPVLRKDGFQGSARKFHCHVRNWLQVVTVQGSKWGGAFAVNLGIHYVAAPDVIGNRAEPRKMTEAHCEFRRRLSETMADHWWNHDGDMATMLAALESAASIYVRFGREYFARALAALETVTPQDLASGIYDLQGFGSTKPRLGLALARIRRLEGDTASCRGFAEYGLQHLGPAGLLKAELDALAAA